MTKAKPKQRWIVMSVPGRDEADEGAWFAYDIEKHQSIECDSAGAATEVCKLNNAGWPPAFRCPQCGENGIDRLEWLDRQTLRCLRCGTEYQPKGGSHDR